MLKVEAEHPHERLELLCEHGLDQEVLVMAEEEEATRLACRNTGFEDLLGIRFDVWLERLSEVGILEAVHLPDELEDLWSKLDADYALVYDAAVFQLKLLTLLGFGQQNLELSIHFYDGFSPDSAIALATESLGS